MRKLPKSPALCEDGKATAGHEPMLPIIGRTRAKTPGISPLAIKFDEYWQEPAGMALNAAAWPAISFACDGGRVKPIERSSEKSIV